MAARKRKKAKSSAPKRRRRRRAATVAVRRSSGRRGTGNRRVSVTVRQNPPRRRRHFRRNPFGIGGAGMMGEVKDGAVIVFGQWGAARLAQLAVKAMPASFIASSPLASVAVANGVAAIGASWIAKRFFKRNGRLMAAAAWAQAITSTIGATEQGARLLAGQFSAPPANPPASGVAGYASGRRLAGYASGGRSTLAGYSSGGDSASASRTASVGGTF